MPERVGVIAARVLGALLRRHDFFVGGALLSALELCVNGFARNDHSVSDMGGHELALRDSNEDPLT